MVHTRNGDKSLVKEDASSRKLKTQQKMIAVIKKSSFTFSQGCGVHNCDCKCKKSD